MTQFSDLKLDPKVLKAIAEAGYTEPTPIQAQAIPPALEGRDVLGIAQTGTGKTAGFTLPMITLLGRGRARARMPRSLILCPTRELAAQVAENFDLYAKHTRLTKALLIGGVSFHEQDKLIDRGVDVLIATPGRLLDHFERGKLLLTGVQIMVVDEADRMLDMGFIPDIEHIFQLTPFTRQTLFFSATMAPEIERITDTFLHNPERIEIARQATASETIDQRLIEMTPTRKDQTAKQKREVLRALIEAEGAALTNAIIFCNRKTDVDIVSKSLKAHGYDAAPIHGDLDQRVRTATLDGFRDGNLRFLVASDVAARGLDIPAVSHVFNFDLPSHAEDYVHRIGRTGRAGREGIAISLSVPADEKYLSAIESLLKRSLPRAALPSDFSLSEAAQTQPRSGGERKRSGSESRSRSGRTSARRDEARADGARKHHHGHTAEKAPEPAAKTAEAGSAAEADKSTHASITPAGQRDSHSPRHTHGRTQRPEARADRRGDRGAPRNGTPVRGLGDAVPEFLTRSFRLEDLPPAPTHTARAAAQARDEDTKRHDHDVARADDAAPAPAPASSTVSEPATAESAEAAVGSATNEAKPPPARRRRSRKESAPAEPATEAAADVAQEGPASPADAPDDAPADAPKPKARRTRKTATTTSKAADTEKDEATAGDTGKAAADTDAATSGEDTTEPAKPVRRTRKPRATTAKAKAAEAAAVEAATATDAPVTETAETTDAPKAKPAPRRRRRKADDEPDSAVPSEPPAEDVPGKTPAAS